jgi:hypothetical protein
MKKMLNIPEEYYKESSFLRSIKINYLKFGALSEKQVEFFHKAVKKLKEEHDNPTVEKFPEEVHFDVSLRAIRNAQREKKAAAAKKKVAK